MTVKPVPDGYQTVSPWLISDDTAKLITFLKDAFGAEELGRVTSEDGNIGHAEVRIGDSVVLLFDRSAVPADAPILERGADGERLPSPSFLRLYAKDCDAVCQRALEAGATSITEVADFFGERVGRVRDPLGNVWWLQTHIQDVSDEELLESGRDWMKEQGV